MIQCLHVLYIWSYWMLFIFVYFRPPFIYTISIHILLWHNKLWTGENRCVTRVSRDTSVLHQSVETANLCPKTELRNFWIISYFVLFSFLCVRWPSFPTSCCPSPRCAHHVFCTLFSCLSIDSSLYHVIFSHVTVFSVFFGKSKVELCDPQCEFLITDIWINCEWFVIKLCGIGIILLMICLVLLADLLCGITSYYVSINLRFVCIFKIKNRMQ